MGNNASKPLRLLPIVLVLLSSACATNSPSTVPPSVDAPRRPALPAQARQKPRPPECQPTCSSNLERELNDLAAWLASSRARLMPPTPPAQPANGQPTR